MCIVCLTMYFIVEDSLVCKNLSDIKQNYFCTTFSSRLDFLFRYYFISIDSVSDDGDDASLPFIVVCMGNLGCIGCPWIRYLWQMFTSSPSQ